MRLISCLLLVPMAACTHESVDSGRSPDTDSLDDTAETADTADTADNEPVVPRIAWFDDFAAVDIAPDGTTALVQRTSSIEGELLLIDTATDTFTTATTLGDATQNLATGLSADGKIAAMHGIPVQAGVWSQAAGWVDLPSPYRVGCDINEGGAFDVSDDGSVVVGFMWDECAPAAFRWTAADGVQMQEIIGEASQGSSAAPTNRASVVSGDGLVAAGFAAYGGLDRSPARWTADGQGELLAPDDHEQMGEVLASNYDGSTLGVLLGYDGYAWIEGRSLVTLGRLATALPTDPIYPNALSADGQVVFGGVGSEFFTVPTAFVWTEAQGMRSLQEVAAAAGVVIEKGFWLGNVMAVSDDGTVLLGRGYDADFAAKAFVMHVPAGTWGS